jgi:hypothetical protein
MDYKITNDGSKTLFSSQYNQTFHSMQDGALSEALHKHIIPAFTLLNEVKELNILDICFGLGYNTLGTIYYILKNNLNIKVNFFSPEFDEKLVESLKDFDYPKEFDEIKHIIKVLSLDKFYQDDKFKIEIYIGDARKYIKNLTSIDIVYQDAFSSDTNKELWTKEYFSDIEKILSKKALITTYSIATPVRMSLYENNLYIYEYQSIIKKRSTIATNFQMMQIDNIELKYTDMERKKLHSPNAIALTDN